MDYFCFFLVRSSQGAAGFNVMDDSSQPLVPASSGSSCDLAVCSPHYLFDSELSGAPRPWVFGGCVFSFYAHPPYRTPSELAPLFNDVSVLLPQSLSSLLTSWLPRSLLFLLATTPWIKHCWSPFSADLLTSNKKKKKKKTFLSRHPITHKVAPNSKPDKLHFIRKLSTGGNRFIISEWPLWEIKVTVTTTVFCLQLVYAHGKNENIHPLLPLLNMCFCVSKNTHTRWHHPFVMSQITLLCVFPLVVPPSGRCWLCPLRWPNLCLLPQNKCLFRLKVLFSGDQLRGWITTNLEENKQI